MRAFKLLNVYKTAIAGFIILLGMVFGTGNTFGQRCARVYQDPQAIEKCVQRLSQGKPIEENK